MLKNDCITGEWNVKLQITSNPLSQCLSLISILVEIRGRTIFLQRWIDSDILPCITLLGITIKYILDKE